MSVEVNMKGQVSMQFMEVFQKNFYLGLDAILTGKTKGSSLVNLETNRRGSNSATFSCLELSGENGGGKGFLNGGDVNLPFDRRMSMSPKFSCLELSGENEGITGYLNVGHEVLGKRKRSKVQLKEEKKQMPQKRAKKKKKKVKKKKVNFLEPNPEEDYIYTHWDMDTDYIDELHTPDLDDLKFPGSDGIVGAVISQATYQFDKDKEYFKRKQYSPSYTSAPMMYDSNKGFFTKKKIDKKVFQCKDYDLPPLPPRVQKDRDEFFSIDTNFQKFIFHPEKDLSHYEHHFDRIVEAMSHIENLIEDRMSVYQRKIVGRQSNVYITINPHSFNMMVNCMKAEVTPDFHMKEELSYIHGCTTLKSDRYTVEWTGKNGLFPSLLNKNWWLREEPNATGVLLRALIYRFRLEYDVCNRKCFILFDYDTWQFTGKDWVNTRVLKRIVQKRKF